MSSPIYPAEISQDKIDRAKIDRAKPSSRRRFLTHGLQTAAALSAVNALPFAQFAQAETGFGEDKTVMPVGSSPVAVLPPKASLNFTDIKTACESRRDTGVPVHLVAPSGFGGDEQRNLLAIHRLTQAGFYVDNPEIISRKYLRFAGTDSERVADISQFLHTPVAQLPKILMGVRGGYGAMRLFKRLTPEQWHALAKKFAQRGTLLIGFSDFTALQLALLAQGHLPYVAGAMLGSDFGKAVVNVPTMQSFIQLCTQPTLAINVQASQPFIGQQRTLTGTLWGGNLSVLSAMVGSPFFPNIDKGILFIEDTGEQPYRIERMLQTLQLAGVLANQQAILLGKFNFKGTNDIGINDAYDGDYTFNSVIDYFHKLTNLPILTEFPFGHVAERINFPMGVPVTIAANPQGYTASFSHFYNLTQEKNYKHLDFNQLLV